MAISKVYRAYVKEYHGPFAVVRECTICGHLETVRKGLRKGRGYGFREGNKARGRMITHIKTNHPKEAKEAS